MVFSFEKLFIYQRSVDFLERMDRLLAQRPAEANGEVVEILRRSCLEIPTWIANGNSRRHREDRKDCYRRSRSSAFTCLPCLEVLTRRGEMPGPLSDAIREELFCITKMLSALIHSQDRIETKATDEAAGPTS